MQEYTDQWQKGNFEVLQQAFETLQTEHQERFNSFVANKKVS
jgi:hypothetical protein